MNCLRDKPVRGVATSDLPVHLHTAPLMGSAVPSRISLQHSCLIPLAAPPAAGPTMALCIVNALHDKTPPVQPAVPISFDTSSGGRVPERAHEALINNRRRWRWPMLHIGGRRAGLAPLNEISSSDPPRTYLPSWRRVSRFRRAPLPRRQPVPPRMRSLPPTTSFYHPPHSTPRPAHRSVVDKHPVACSAAGAPNCARKLHAPGRT